MLMARKGLPGHEVYAKSRNAIELIELFECPTAGDARRGME